MSFSQRMGITPKKEIIQIDTVDDALTNRLWNNILTYYLNLFNYSSDQGYVENSSFRFIPNNIWNLFCKEPIDNIPKKTDIMKSIIRKRFFSMEWHSKYDFIEFLVNIDVPQWARSSNNEPEPFATYILVTRCFIEACNTAFQEEISGYRFIDKKIVPISDRIEVKTVENSMLEAKKYPVLIGVKNHIQGAIDHFSDRKKPDYRNSIKESISAIEAICQVLSGDSKAELGKALKKLSEKIYLHPALKDGFIKLYGYTSDGDGIRHAMLEESNLDFEDAKFMLVACSGFVNYLIMKANKVGLLS